MYTIHFFHLKTCFFYISFILIFNSCRNNNPKVDKTIDSLIINSIKTSNNITPKTLYLSTLGSLEQKIIDAGLVDIQIVSPSILVDLKYSSVDNFMRKDVYGNLKKAYLQLEVAKSLSDAQNYLKSIDSSLTILVYDAIRPKSVQQFMWDYLEMPISEKIKFVSNPKNGSIHNYGSAVDLTIAKVNGIPLDMGAKYDEIGKIAYPKLETDFLLKGLLNKKQIENRRLLRKVMKKGNFIGISTEWWHFNRFSRREAKLLYQIIE